LELFKAALVSCPSAIMFKSMFSSTGAVPNDHDKTAEDSRNRARGGHAPGSESDEDRPGAPPDLQEVIDAAIAKITDKLVTALIPALMTSLTPEINKYLAFELGTFKVAVKLEVTNISSAVKDIAGRLEAVDRRPQASSAGGGDLQAIQDIQRRLAGMQMRLERQDQISRTNNLIIHKVKEGVGLRLGMFGTSWLACFPGFARVASWRPAAWGPSGRGLSGLDLSGLLSLTLIQSM